jgi:hypothetical protein
MCSVTMYVEHIFKSAIYVHQYKWREHNDNECLWTVRFISQMWVFSSSRLQERKDLCVTLLTCDGKPGSDDIPKSLVAGDPNFQGPCFAREFLQRHSTTGTTAFLRCVWWSCWGWEHTGRIDKHWNEYNYLWCSCTVCDWIMLLVRRSQVRSSRTR